MNLHTIFFVLCALIALGNSKGSRRPVAPKIVGGEPANIEDYPYQISVLFGGSHGCGGSIINENFILTAAHCTYGEGEDNVSIRAGSSIINSGGTVIKVAKINQHPQFNIDTMDYDISVLQLEESLELGSGVAPVDLIGAGEDVSNGEMAVATGWGRLTYEGEIPSQLQRVKIPIIVTADCEQFYGTGDDGISNRMFCAGFPQGGKDTCQGDSGGPLVVDGVQVGITSWGDICGEASTPGVYTKLSLFRDFVDKIVNN